MFNDVRTLDECEDEFVQFLEKQVQVNQDRNSDWFPRLLRDYKKYLFWSVCFSEDQIVAFSAIQKHFFPPGCVRILTRTFFAPSIRLQPGYNLWVETPVAPMARLQLKWLRNQSDITTALVTMETRHRRDYFSKIIGKINKRADASFVVLDERMQTYPNQPPESFHHVASMGLKCT